MAKWFSCRAECDTKLSRKKAKTLIEHLETTEEDWLRRGYDTNIDGDSSEYAYVDYEALVKEIDTFSARIKKERRK